MGGGGRIGLSRSGEDPQTAEGIKDYRGDWNRGNIAKRIDLSGVRKIAGGVTNAGGGVNFRFQEGCELEILWGEAKIILGVNWRYQGSFLGRLIRQFRRCEWVISGRQGRGSWTENQRRGELQIAKGELRISWGVWTADFL